MVVVSWKFVLDLDSGAATLGIRTFMAISCQLLSLVPGDFAKFPSICPHPHFCFFPGTFVFVLRCLQVLRNLLKGGTS